MANLGMFAGLALLGLMMIMVLQYGQTTIASTDIGVNLSGTAYNDTYHNQTHTTRATMNFMGFMPYFVGIAALIAALFLLVPGGKNYL